MSSDLLQAVRSQTAPRSDDVVEQIVKPLVPCRRFAFYGVLYFLFVAIQVPAFVVGLAFGDLLPVSLWTLLVAPAVAFLLSWLPFVYWVRRRLESERLLGRNGQLHEARMAELEPTRVVLSPFTQVTLEFGSPGARRRTKVALEGHGYDLGSTLPLLAHPKSPHCCVFGAADHVIVGRVLDPRRQARLRVVTGALLVLIGPLIMVSALKRHVVECTPSGCEYRQELFGSAIRRDPYPIELIRRTRQEVKMMPAEYRGPFVSHYGVAFALPSGVRLAEGPWLRNQKAPELLRIFEQVHEPRPVFLYRSPQEAQQWFWALIGLAVCVWGARRIRAGLRGRSG